MRTATITLAGEERILCFSTRVLLAVNERFGSPEAMFDKLMDREDASGAFDASLWVLEQMMAAGAKYAKQEGLEPASPLTAEDILDLTTPGEILGLGTKIREALSAGTDREVEAKPPKNGKAGAEPGTKSKARRAPSGGSGTGSASA